MPYWIVCVLQIYCFLGVHALHLEEKIKRSLFAVTAVLFSSIYLYSQTIDLGEIITIIDSPEKIELKIDSEEIKKSASKDLPELLRNKGLLVMNTGGSGTASNLSFKGYAGFCCKVYIDGVLATQPGTGEFDWNSIDINSIESITVSEIPGTTTDQFAGCAVYIKTRLVSTRGFDVKTLVTSYEKSLADTAGIFGEYRDVFGNTGIKVNVQADKANNSYLKKNDRPLENNWSSLVNLSASFNTLLTDSATVSGTSKVFKNQVKPFNSGSAKYSGLEEDLNVFNTVKFRYVTQKLAVFSANLTAQYNCIDYYYDIDRKDITKMHQTDLLLTLENFYGFEASSVFSLENKMTGAKKDRFHNTTKIAWSWKGGDWIKITPSAGILVSSNDDFEFLPQISVSSAKTGLSVTAFRQFVLPTFNQLYWDAGGGKGNPDLTPENGWAVVAGWRSPFNFFPVKAVYTYGHYQNKIRWITVGGVLMPDNTLSADYRTLEFSAAKSWKHLDLNGGVTNTKALLESGKQIMWVPQWQWNAGATVHAGPIDAGVSFIYTGRRPKQNDNKEWYNAEKNLGASVNWRFIPEATLFISGANLLDERNVYHDGYAAPGRSLTVGFMIRK